MNPTIEPAQQADHFHQVARLHQQGIKEGFLSSLGIPFLTALYRGINKVDDCGVLIALQNEQVLGFIAYAKDVKACYKQTIRRSFFPLCLALLPNALNPAIYKKILETLRYPSQHPNPPRSLPATESRIPHLPPTLRSELLSMAVSPQTRGQGIGKQLVAAVDTQMRAMNIPQYYVVTHALDKRSNAFYQSCNFTRTRTFQNHNKPMHEYIKHLP